MTKNNYTHLALLVDRSGSMQPLAAESSNSINNLFEEQAKVEGEMTVSLYQFDDQYEKVFGPTFVQEAPKYTLESRGMTALNDSAMRAIKETGEFLRGLPENMRPEKVIFTIVTDGQENASHEATLKQVQETITHQTEKYGWEFVFMASGIDAFATGFSYGINNNVAMSASTKSYDASYSGLNNALFATRTVGGTMASNMVSNDYTDDSEDEDVTGSWQQQK